MTGGEAKGRGPLSGIRILEVGHMLAGPYCGMVLADLGAEVIKIEPASGDIGRSVSPHAIGPHNLYFASLNRSKKSVCLDLASADGQQQLHRLAASSHALITNLRPKAIRKLGLTYAALKAANAKLVCLALTGYGLEGAYAEHPAYDYVIQALTGVMALTGEPGGPPVKCGYSVVDNTTGLMGAVGLLAKIVEGRGGQLDVSLYDCMVSQLNYLAAGYLNAGERPRRQAGGGHPYIVPAQLFATADGHLALFISHDGFWRDFCAEVGRPEWAEDARFATMRARAENRDAVTDAVSTLLAERPTAQWVEKLAPKGIVIAGVEELGDALESDLTASRRMVVSVPTPDGPLRLIGDPIKIDGRASAYGPPPLLGEHSTELLEELETA